VRPGHTSGDTAFHLPKRRVLLTGDALANDKLLTSTTGARLLPRIFNHDWEAAVTFLDRLLVVEADVLPTGHGVPLHLSPAEAAEQARRLAASGGWWN
jgi:glyoxylase-like metal-dependent hydrolase (beta-lactamase superfamily II)